MRIGLFLDEAALLESLFYFLPGCWSVWQCYFSWEEKSLDVYCILIISGVQTFFEG